MDFNETLHRLELGHYAGYSNTTGDNWTAVGLNAGHSNITGNNWTTLTDEDLSEILTGQPTGWVCIFNSGVAKV